MRKAVIHSTGMYVPERVVKNDYFDKLLGENVSEWLESNVQIFERRWCTENQSTADLVVEAAKEAMSKGEVNPDEIDLLIVATDTPEYISPSTSSVAQHRLGLLNAGTFDINTACAGYVTAFDTASKFIMSDHNYNTVMIVGVYAMSKYLNMLDKKTVNLFADGAGCAILKSEKNSDRGLLASKLITRGEYYDYMGIYAGGTNKIIDNEVIKNKDDKLNLTKKFPPELNPQMWASIARDLSDNSNVALQMLSNFCSLR
jgi:3-oxoacyl-[acyl-carrier-protein] synthase-3